MTAFFLGIAGGSASGKSWLSRRLLASLGEDRATHITHDDYYLPLPDHLQDRPGDHNFDHPDALETALLVEHLCALRQGRAVQVPTYDFATHNRVGQHTVLSRPVVVVEGILLFTHPALRELLDLRVFVHAPAAVRRERRVARDITERGREPAWVHERFDRHVEPMHQAHVEPTRAHAHLVVDGCAPLDTSAHRVLHHLRDSIPG